MEETREDKLIGLKLKKLELERLQEKDEILTKEIKEIESEQLLK